MRVSIHIIWIIAVLGAAIYAVAPEDEMVPALVDYLLPPVQAAKKPAPVIILKGDKLASTIRKSDKLIVSRPRVMSDLMATAFTEDVLRGEDGMFRVSAFVNDEPTNFLIDTGAQYVSLSSSTAKKLGRLIPAGFDSVTLASGENLVVQRVIIPRISIGLITVNNVKGAVLPDPGNGQEVTNLLGQAFLASLRRWEYLRETDTLALEQ